MWKPESIKVGTYWKLDCKEKDNDYFSVKWLKSDLRNKGATASYYKVLRGYRHNSGIKCIVDGVIENVSEIMWENLCLEKIDEDEYLIGTLN